MRPEWMQFEDTSLGKRKADEVTVDNYVSERQIQSYCTSHGYVAAVLRGRQCSFYNGPAEMLFAQKKTEPNAHLFISISEMENPHIDSKDEWVVVKEEIGKIEAQDLSREQDEHSERYQEQLLAEKSLSEGVWNEFKLQPQNPKYRSSVCVYQNERWFPLLGWKAPLVYPSWSDAVTGKKVKPCTQIDPPQGTSWCGEWQIDSGFGDMDDGWAYAKDFLLSNSFTDSCTKVDVVRRRRWWRDHTKKPDTIFEA